MHRLWALALVLLSASGRVTDANDAMVNTDRQVLVAVTTDLCAHTKVGYQVLAMSASSGYVPIAFDGVNAAGLKDSVRRSANLPALPTGIGCSRLRPASNAMIAKTFDESGKIPPDWSDFYAAFPGAKGLIRLSLPGYSADATVAVVLVSGSCNNLCGSGSAWELRRTSGDTWHVYKKVGTWIA